jgi:hypothetical protein
MDESALLQKQERLMAQSQFLRDSLSQQVQEWQPSLTMADKCLSAFLWLRQHPIIPALGLVFFIIKKPAWLFTMFRTVFSGWLSLQKLRR